MRIVEGERHRQPKEDASKDIFGGRLIEVVEALRVGARQVLVVVVFARYLSRRVGEGRFTSSSSNGKVIYRQA